MNAAKMAAMMIARGAQKVVFRFHVGCECPLSSGITESPLSGAMGTAVSFGCLFCVVLVKVFTPAQQHPREVAIANAVHCVTLFS